MEEKKAATQALIESIGKKKAFADEAVEASRADEGAAAALQVLVAMLIGYSDSHNFNLLLIVRNAQH